MNEDVGVRAAASAAAQFCPHSSLDQDLSGLPDLGPGRGV